MQRSNHQETNNRQTDAQVKPSFTAVAVAQATLACHEMPEWSHLVEARTATILTHFVNVARPALPLGKDFLSLKLLDISANPIRKFLYDTGGCLAYPQHLALRKLFIETQVREAIKAGVKQVLIIGGGYDTLALRLHQEFPGVQFIEADRGPTREIKLKALATLGNILPDFKQLGANLHYLECDLSRADWTQFLLNQGFFSNQADSVVIAEGVTPYLTIADVNNLLAKLREEIMTDKSQFLVGFAGPASGLAAIVTNSLIKESGETYQCHITANQVPLYCAKSGFKISARALSTDLQRLAGNEDVIKYQDHPEKFAPEHYFVLEKIPGWLANNEATHIKPGEVKDIPVGLISIQEPNKPSDSCVIC